VVPLKFGKLWAGNNAKNIRGKPDISNKCFVHSPAADMQKITFDHLKICNGGRSLFVNQFVKEETNMEMKMSHEAARKRALELMYRGYH